MKTKLLFESNCQQCRLSKKLNNGDWDYYLLIVLDIMNEYEQNPKSKYVISVEAISPTAANSKVKQAVESCDVQNPNNVKEIIVALHTYGVYAILWSKAGNNKRELLKEARHELMMISGFFGFYMDVKQNMFGNTGWDLICGNVGWDYITKIDGDVKTLSNNK